MYYSEAQMREEEDAAFGDGYPNEIARASAEARLSRRPAPNERAEAERLTRLGYAVICCTYAVYCTVTSAVIGEGFSIERICNTRAYADYLARPEGYDHGDPDYSKFVFDLPETRKPAQPLSGFFGSDDEVPF